VITQPTASQPQPTPTAQTIPSMAYQPQKSIQATGGFVQQQTIMPSGPTFQQPSTTFTSVSTGGLLQASVQNQANPAFTNVTAGVSQPAQPILAGALTGNVVGQSGTTMFPGGGTGTVAGPSSVTNNNTPTLQTGTVAGQSGVRLSPPLQYRPTSTSNATASVTPPPPVSGGSSMQCNAAGLMQYTAGGPKQYMSGSSVQYKQYNTGGSISMQYYSGGSTQYNTGTSMQYNPALAIPGATTVAGGVSAPAGLSNPAPAFTITAGGFSQPQMQAKPTLSGVPPAAVQYNPASVFTGGTATGFSQPQMMSAPQYNLPSGVAPPAQFNPAPTVAGAATGWFLQPQAYNIAPQGTSATGTLQTGLVGGQPGVVAVRPQMRPNTPR